MHKLSKILSFKFIAFQSQSSNAITILTKIPGKVCVCNIPRPWLEFLFNYNFYCSDKIPWPKAIWRRKNLFFFLVDIPSLRDVRKGTAGRKLERRNTAKSMENASYWLHPHALLRVLFHTTCIKNLNNIRCMYRLSFKICRKCENEHQKIKCQSRIIPLENFMRTFIYFCSYHYHHVKLLSFPEIRCVWGRGSL